LFALFTQPEFSTLAAWKTWQWCDRDEGFCPINQMEYELKIKMSVTDEAK
jgi:hypothetical protein